MKRLIINADDFGLTHGVNRAIVECHQHGIVTSATLMANSGAFDDAVALAKQNPGLSVGCHVTLLDSRPLLPASQVESLLKDGQEFYRTVTEFAPRALVGRFRPDEIASEATAQFRRIQQSGIVISHFDTHKHAHMFPSVLEPLLQAAKACGIPAVRNPFEPASATAFSKVLGDRKLFVRWAEVNVLRTLRSSFTRLVRKYGLRTTDGSLGVAGTGTMNLMLFGDAIHRVPSATWEFVCHPGYNDSELDAIRTKLRDSRESERNLLTSQATRKIVEHIGAELISFQQLQPELSRA